MIWFLAVTVAAAIYFTFQHFNYLPWVVMVINGFLYISLCVWILFILRLLKIKGLGEPKTALLVLVKQIQDIPSLFILLLGGSSIGLSVTNHVVIRSKRLCFHLVWCLVTGGLFVILPNFYLGWVIPMITNGKYFDFGLRLVLDIFPLLGLWVLLIRKWFRFQPLPLGRSSLALFITSVLTMIVFLLGVILMAGFWRLVCDHALVQAKVRVVAAGYRYQPLQDKNLPDEQNAVYYFAQAYQTQNQEMAANHGDYYKNHMKDYPGITVCCEEGRFEWEVLIDSRKGKISPGQMKLARYFVKEHKVALKLLEKAYEVQAVDWKWDKGQQSQFTLPGMGKAYGLNCQRQLEQLILVKSVVDAQMGRLKDTLRDLRIGLFLADACNEPYSMVCVMARVELYNDFLSQFQSPLFTCLIPSKVEKEFFLEMHPWVLEEDFRKAIEYELIYRYYSLEIASPLESFEYAFYSGSDQIGFLNEVANDGRCFTRGLSNLFNWPFEPYDLAVQYRAALMDLKFWKKLHPENTSLEEAALTGFNGDWRFLRILRYGRIHFGLAEKINEYVTKCYLAQLTFEIHMFNQKYKRWPATVGELKKWCVGNWSFEAGIRGPFPDVKVTGAFISKAVNPSGNKVILAHKGQVPTDSGSGWLYDSHSGSIYVNSTVHDSQNVAYSFYGFE